MPVLISAALNEACVYVPAMLLLHHQCAPPSFFTSPQNLVSTPQAQAWAAAERSLTSRLRQAEAAAAAAAAREAAAQEAADALQVNTPYMVAHTHMVPYAHSGPQG